MNQTQVKYARERAKKIYDLKVKSLTDKFTTPGKNLTNDDKFKALREGNFKITERKTFGNMWYNYVDFGETFPVTDTEGRNAELKKLTKFYDDLIDELVLGDNEKALELIKELENFA